MARIEPIEFEGQHFVEVDLGDGAKKYGPYREDEAGVMVRRFAAIYNIFKNGLADRSVDPPMLKRRAG